LKRKEDIFLLEDYTRPLQKRMAPTSSQVHELCADLKFIAKVGEDQKVHVGSKQIHPAKDMLTRLIRLFTWETKEATIKYVQEKTERAAEFADQLYADRANSDSRDLLIMLLSDLEDCIRADHGIEALVKTYQDKHKAASVLEVIIRTIRVKIAKYHEVLSPQLPPLPDLI